MITRERIPIKADEAEEIFGLVVGLALVVLALAAIVMVVSIAIMIVLALAPTAAGICWLSSLNTHYEISKRKKIVCALMGTGLFLLPMMLVIVADPSIGHQNSDDLIAALWLGTLLGFCGTALFLSIDAYRQIFWQHHKTMFIDRCNSLTVGFHLWKAQRTLARINQALERIENENEQMIYEHKKLAKMTNDLIQSNDVAFYSAERLRWQREYAAMNIDQLKEKLGRINENIKQIPDSDPRNTTLTLEAAVVRLEVEDRSLGVLEHQSYTEAKEKRQEYERTVLELQHTLEGIQNKINTETVAIQHLRQTRPIVN